MSNPTLVPRPTKKAPPPSSIAHQLDLDEEGLVSLGAALQAELVRLREALRHARVELDRERAQFEREKEEVLLLLFHTSLSSPQVRQHAAQTSDMISLNVGGVRYSTTRLALCRYEESMLGVLLSGRHTIKLDEEGSVFLDRNGATFALVLDFLREPSAFVPPAEEDQRQRLLVEADYFRLDALIERIALDERRPRYLTFGFIKTPPPFTFDRRRLKLSDDAQWHAVLGDQSMSKGIWYWEFHYHSKYELSFTPPAPTPPGMLRLEWLSPTSSTGLAA